MAGLTGLGEVGVEGDDGAFANAVEAVEGRERFDEGGVFGSDVAEFEGLQRFTEVFTLDLPEWYFGAGPIHVCSGWIAGEGPGVIRIATGEIVK